MTDLRTYHVSVELNEDGVPVIRQQVENSPEARAYRREQVEARLNEKGWVKPTVDLSNATVAYQ